MVRIPSPTEIGAVGSRAAPSLLLCYHVFALCEGQNSWVLPRRIRGCSCRSIAALTQSSVKCCSPVIFGAGPPTVLRVPGFRAHIGAAILSGRPERSDLAVGLTGRLSYRCWSRRSVFPPLLPALLVFPPLLALSILGQVEGENASQDEQIVFAGRRCPHRRSREADPGAGDCRDNLIVAFNGVLMLEETPGHMQVMRAGQVDSEAIYERAEEALPHRRRLLAVPANVIGRAEGDQLPLNFGDLRPRGSRTTRVLCRVKTLPYHVVDGPTVFVGDVRSPRPSESTAHGSHSAWEHLLSFTNRTRCTSTGPHPHRDCAGNRLPDRPR